MAIKYVFFCSCLVIYSEIATAASESSNLDKFFFSGGWLMWPLLGLSIITIHLIIQYMFQVRTRQFYDTHNITEVREHLRHGRVQPCLELLKNDNSMLGQMLQMGLSENKLGHTAMENAMIEVLENIRGVFFRKLEWLNIIGNVAPMIGLFGTVWGMIIAFSAIVEAGGRPQPVDLAAGISNALVTTFWGMAVAIPAISGSGYLSNRFESLTAKTAVTAEELLAALSTSESGSTT